MHRLSLFLAEAMAWIVSTILLVTKTVQLFGALVAILLTIFTGQWLLLFLVLMTAVLGPPALAISLIPGTLIGFVATKIIHGSLRHVGYVLLGLSHMLVLGCTAAWTYFIGTFFIFMEWVPDVSPVVILVKVLWAYETTTGVLAFMAAKSGDDEMSWPVYTVTSVAALAFLTTLASTRSTSHALIPLVSISAMGSLVLTWVAVQRERGEWL